MGTLKNIGYTVLTVAVASALYLAAQREFYAIGVKANYAGQQVAIRKLLRNIDEELGYCKPADHKIYKLPRFRRVERTTPEGTQEISLELKVDCGGGSSVINFKKVPLPLPMSLTFW